jgi:hypothetical protein
MVCLAHSMEAVEPEGGGPPIMRPVLRLPDQGIVFTRIAADRRETSMIMHIRPGWTSLRDYLRPQTDVSTGYCVSTCQQRCPILLGLQGCALSEIVGRVSSPLRHGQGGKTCNLQASAAEAAFRGVCLHSSGAWLCTGGLAHA